MNERESDTQDIEYMELKQSTADTPFTETQRTWAEVRLSTIEQNYRAICQQANTPVLCVVKANAYGHGAVPVARRLAACGAPYFAVATVKEAVELRTNGITTPILILGYVAREEMETVARQHITATVYDTETAMLLSKAASRVGESVTVHYKIDTGMTRLGFATWSQTDSQHTIHAILDCARLPYLHSEGIFTHFAVADTSNTANVAYTRLQYERFATICDALQTAGLDLPLRHCANSGAIQQYGEMHKSIHPPIYESMKRAGIILYGYRADPALPAVMKLQPAMTVKARVAQVREIPADTTVSYGRTFQTTAPTRLAVVTIGYADGYLRTGSGQAHMLLHGVRVPVVGRICMDMCMLDISALPDDDSVCRGDEVTVFGDIGWTADDVAQAAGTISYEVLCAVSCRVPRIYLA